MKADVEELKKAMKQKGWETAYRLAFHTGLDQKTIGNVLKGKGCRASTIEEIARALQVPVQTLILEGGADVRC